LRTQSIFVYFSTSQNSHSRTPEQPMPRKGTRKSQGRIKATAKIEAVARATATYQHKKTVTEVIPPDVSRAKAHRWLDLISPITEWAGLRGDALRFQRDQLRIRQEASLERLAASIRDRMQGQHVLHPLPPKILVPALEGASLES